MEDKIVDNSEIRYIGKVKWFGDNQKNANYGFIESKGLDDIFVHERTTVSKISENDTVIFQIRKSKKDEKKFEAYNVCLINEYNDLDGLLDLILNYGRDYTIKNLLLERLVPLDPNGDKLLKAKNIQKIEEKYLNILSVDGSTLSYSTVSNVYSELSRLFNNSKSNLNKFFQKTKNNNIQFVGWINNSNDSFDKELISKYYESSDSQLKKLILNSSDNKSCSKLIENELTKNETISEENTLKYYLNIYASVKDRKDKIAEKFITLIYGKSVIEIRYKLWQENYSTVLTEELEKYIFANVHTFTPSVLKSTLAKLQGKQKINFLKSLIDKKNKIFTEEGYEKYKIVLKEISLIKNAANEKLIENLNEKLTPNYKVISWLDGYLILIDVNSIIESICVLPYDSQIRCIKKLFECYRLKSIEFKVGDLEKMIDYNLSKKIDFNILLALQMIILSVNSKIINARSLTSFVLKSFSSGIVPELSSEFFEKCTGRAITDEILIDKKLSKKINKTNKIPIGITYCEGRKAKSKSNSENVKEDGLEFWWCKNKPCFQNELSSILKEHWKDYTLFDLLLCVGENIDEDKHSYHLGVINKILLYINSLKCRKCENWLSPAKQSNFAHDRVNLFECTQKKCSEYQRKIYLSHCLNSKCDNIVDNRDSEKCDHNWVICDYCLACCSTNKMAKRNYILNKTGQETNTAVKGHDETEEIFCFNCGSKFNLSSTEIDDEKYKKCLDWLEKHKIDRKRIAKSGKTKKGKRWYLIKKLDNETLVKYEELIEKFQQAGFNAKSGNFENSYLISEPNFEKQVYLKCSNAKCGYVINLDDLLYEDRDRLRAMLYHKKIRNVYANKFKFESKQS